MRQPAQISFILLLVSSGCAQMLNGKKLLKDMKRCQNFVFHGTVQLKKKKKSGIRIHELGHEIWHLDVCSRDVIHRCVSRRLKFRGYITHQADRAKVIFFCLCINELCKVIRPISFLHLFPPYVALILYIAQ